MGQIKSYASILSGGLSKVKNVFKQKSKEDSSSDKESKSKRTVELERSETKREPEVSIIRNQEPNHHPDIPGLLFKKDIERRNSKKKRKSQVLDESTGSDKKRVHETREVVQLKEPMFDSKSDLRGDGFVEVK